jgi:hypothetical protein
MLAETEIRETTSAVISVASVAVASFGRSNTAADAMQNESGERTPSA